MVDGSCVYHRAGPWEEESQETTSVRYFFLIFKKLYTSFVCVFHISSSVVVESFNFIDLSISLLCLSFDS